jgi:tetratricopeptide (TPR) repeat protein
LDKALEHGSEAIALTPGSHPELPDRYSDLGLSYNDRYERWGDIHDLNQAIECDSRAFALTPRDHPDFPRRHSELGASYSARYRRLGELTDLEKANEHHLYALLNTPAGHPRLAERYNNVAASYGDRYKRLGELDDLQKETEYQANALALTPATHPDFPQRCANLGIAFVDRYRRLGALSDLEKATQCHFDALTHTSDNHSDYHERHAALGLVYNYRYRKTDELADLEKAIEHNSGALTRTPDSHVVLSERHGALGMSYRDRYQRLGESADLEKAVEHDSHALTLTPDDHPQLSLRHFCWALSQHNQYQQTSDPSHLEASLDSFRKACQPQLASAPRDKFGFASFWAKLVYQYNYPLCIEAFQTTIDLLPQFIWLGSTISQRYSDLSFAGSVVGRAASAAVLSSEYSMALEWLERARCVVWNQILMLRSPLDDLAASHPELATQLQSATQRLHHASSNFPGSGADLAITDATEHRHRLAKEYNILLAQARREPGFESFLQPAKLTNLLRTARYGPIVVINCHDAHCDGLVILPGQDHVSHVKLPNFSQKKAQQARWELDRLLRQKRVRERVTRMKFRIMGETSPDAGPVLAALWHGVVKPVLDFLGYIVRPAVCKLTESTNMAFIE